uniref:Metallo-beta-lactamase domain-containing protein 1 n=1 Tax=Parastrongyloides trichosuri TaxID=131310 RepID=A0A0N4Z8Q1_PARTI
MNQVKRNFYLLFFIASIAVLFAQQNFIRGKGHGSISKVSMVSLTNGDSDDVFGDIRRDSDTNREGNQYVVNNKEIMNDELSEVINLDEQKFTVGPSKIIKPNIVQSNNKNIGIESSLLSLSGSFQPSVTTKKYWNSPAPLKTLIMPKSEVEKKKIQGQIEDANNDLTEEELFELTKYVEEYITNINFRQSLRNNLQTETLFAKENHTSTKKPMLKVTRPLSTTTTTTTVTTTTTTTTQSPIDKRFHTDVESKEKLKQFRSQFNKWLDELRLKASNISKGFEIRDSKNLTINENYIIKSTVSTVLNRNVPLKKITQPRVKILLKGYVNSFTSLEGLNKKYINMSSTVTLIQDMGKNILIDTGIFSDEISKLQSTRIELLKKLNEVLLSPNDINYVVITSPSMDHTGNVNEFSGAIKFQNGMIYDGSKNGFVLLNLRNNDYFITPNVRLTSTNLQSSNSLNVVVTRSEDYNGIISITGDLFINEYDLFNPNLWKPFSSNVTEQLVSRRTVLCSSDWIIPGHGNIFKVDLKFKEKFC